MIGSVIDPDPRCISSGREKWGDITFYEGYFPGMLMQDQFDLVSMRALFPQLPRWKETLLDMGRIAKKFINVSLTLRLDGTTIVDKDVSYFYYLDSNERAHQVNHNIYELANFLCIHEMRTKKITFYGYTTEYAGHNFRCVPNSKQIKGNLFIEKFGPDEDYPRRMGGGRR